MLYAVAVQVRPGVQLASTRERKHQSGECARSEPVLTNPGPQGTIGIMKDPDGWSALMHGALHVRRGHVQTCHKHAAADNGHKFVLEYLRPYSDMTVRSKNADTILVKVGCRFRRKGALLTGEQAVRNGHLEAVRTIHQWKVDIELPDRCESVPDLCGCELSRRSYGNTPFLVAFIYGQLAILEYLVKAGCDTKVALHSHAGRADSCDSASGKERPGRGLPKHHALIKSACVRLCAPVLCAPFNTCCLGTGRALC
jgi:hypothetical protein